MKILVVKLSSLGDLFHPLPAVRCLKRELGAEIHWVVQEEYAGLVACFSDVSRVIRFPRRGFAAAGRAFVSELRRDRYDIAIDFQGLLKSALTTRMARAERRIGPSFHREEIGRAHV
jgi:heptosyltransferase-1